MYVLRKSPGSVQRGDPEWALERRFFERGVNFGMYVQCAVHVRAVVWNGTEERSFGICQGKSGRAQSYGSVWTVDRYLRACANLHRGLVGRPITFLPLSGAQRGERVHGMRTRGCASVHDERTHSVHRTITNEERGGVRETRKDESNRER